MPQLAFRAGELVFKEGEPSNHAYLLHSGTIEILRGELASPRIIGTIRPNEVFGEMGLIDDRPRRNTARAVTDVQVTSLTREEFSELLLSDPQRCIQYLRNIFERLRQLEAQLAPESEAVGYAQNTLTGKHRLTLYPNSQRANNVLSEKGMAIETFPFRMGRANEASERNAFDLNDLWILDNPPFTISRNHLAFDLIEGSRYVVRDRGSHLGTIVNGKPIGGKASIMVAELHEGDNVVILGSRSSPFQFRVVLESVSS